MLPERISTRDMLLLMKASIEGTPKAISARASRIAKANDLTQYEKPGQMGYWYDKAEVIKASGGKALPKAA